MSAIGKTMYEMSCDHPDLCSAELESDNGGAWLYNTADEARTAAYDRRAHGCLSISTSAGAFTDDSGGHIRGGFTWDTIPEVGRENYRTMVRGVLHAALADVEIRRHDV